MKICLKNKAVRIFPLSLFAGACFLWAGLLIPSMLPAAPVISARYIQAHGTQLVIEITVGSNPPATVILIQRFPSGVKMLDSQPGASHYNEQKDKAKWLLRNLKPGKSTVSITIDRAVTGSEISGKIRFKPSQGEEMIQLPVDK